MINCNNGINIPQLTTDPCNGKTISTSCTIDPNMFSELGLNENSTQEQINQALYLAFLDFKARIEALEL